MYTVCSYTRDCSYYIWVQIWLQPSPPIASGAGIQQQADNQEAAPPYPGTAVNVQPLPIPIREFVFSRERRQPAKEYNYLVVTLHCHANPINTKLWLSIRCVVGGGWGWCMGMLPALNESHPDHACRPIPVSTLSVLYTETLKTEPGLGHTALRCPHFRVLQCHATLFALHHSNYY